MEKNELPTWITVLIWILFAGIITFAFYNTNQKYARRVNNSSFANGIIKGTHKQNKGDQYLDYYFYVDSTFFKGSVGIDFCFKCKICDCKVGTKIKVRYEIKNPSNNDLICE